MNEYTTPSILEIYDSELASMIAKNRGISEMDGLKLFLGSETHSMLTDASLKMWYFSPVSIYDIWENEIATGDPRNSLYIRGDEI